MNDLKRWSRKYPALAATIVFALFGNLMDIWTTGLGMPDGIIESNPFARHTDGSPWILHLIAVKVIYCLSAALYTWIIFEVVSRFHKRLGEVLACIPLAYAGYTTLEAALSNLVIHWGWLVVGQ